MAPTNTNTKPKRKRQRKKREVSSASSGSSSSSSEDDEPAPIPVLPSTLPLSDHSDSSSSASSSSSDESSQDDRAKRRARGADLAHGKSTAPTSAAALSIAGRRTYPSRSPSPAILDPANVPLGHSPFPLLRSLKAGPVLLGVVPAERDAANMSSSDELAQGEQGREAKFGDWWRARLVHEFESELGGLAAEPGLTPARLSLLLTSLTSLSSLHTTSSTSSTTFSASSIWQHDSSTVIDPLVLMTVEDGVEEWGKNTVGGSGDIEVGGEGVNLDEERVAASLRADAMDTAL